MGITKILTWFKNKRMGGIFFISLSILLSFLYLDEIVKIVIISVVKFILVITITILSLRILFTDYYKCLFVDDCDNTLLTPAYRKSSLETFYVILIITSIIVSML